jgi:hypothetical protein
MGLSLRRVAVVPVPRMVRRFVETRSASMPMAPAVAETT